MASSSSSSTSFPPELCGPIASLSTALSEVESRVVSPIVAASTSLNAEDRAKVDLVSAFAVNSLLFIWTRTKRRDEQKEEQIRAELDRVKRSMQRLKEVESKRLKRKSKVDVEAAKRFVVGGLWTPKRGDDDDGASKPKKTKK